MLEIHIGGSILFVYTEIESYNRYYFQLLETEVLIAQGFYGIIKYFGWKKVRIIIQDESLFTAVRKTYTFWANMQCQSTKLCFFTVLTLLVYLYVTMQLYTYWLAFLKPMLLMLFCMSSL